MSAQRRTGTPGPRFADKTCLLTGGASGIGRAAALQFADEGAYVVIGDINDTGAQTVVAEIEAGGGSATALHADVSDPDDLRRLVAWATGQRPSLDVVFANAAILDPAPIEELSDDRFARTLDANLLHPFVLAREAAPALRASGGSIVLMSSTGGLRGIIGQAGYSATKAGVINLTRVLAAELGPTYGPTASARDGSIRRSMIRSGSCWVARPASPSSWRGSRSDARPSRRRSRARSCSWRPRMRPTSPGTP